MRFSNKFVVVTGAAGGIGSAITRRFLSEGAKVCAVDNRTEALNQLVVDLGSPDGLLAIEADVSSESNCKNLSDQVQQTWGAVDILVNNAGKFPVTPFEEISYAEWREICAINLDGPFLMTRSLLPLIKVSKAGRIINTSSGSIFAGTPDQCHYVAAKAGVIGFTRSLANALGQHNITVNAITPGITDTPPVIALFPAAVLDKQAEARAIKRRETADDLVGTVLFLASDDAAFITGQTINVDGGNNFV
ncbi:SDR family NAD(P)-dependent oxidoreductase [Nostoc sp. UHCC 0926]|uniref:SDR family NAD(P)-dependent oxidoreductase n=1 Tax=unclassified Nostoc TaxID=2593658 RepID=UPI002360AC7F|nr:SDR family NAD(P)-dependent oxidoreductase [Nostoc sp. UHCC 0926]WDD34943.1 SDR family NAD(P)-dependent oxidoreductase [Nostoc sp. UHCC 0926]